MSVIESLIDPRSDEFRANSDAMAALVADLRATVDRVRQGGGEASRQRHLARGKLLPPMLLPENSAYRWPSHRLLH